MGKATERPLTPAAGDAGTHSAALALALVAGYHGVACDSTQILRDWLPGADADPAISLQRAARRLGLHARHRRDARARLDRLPLPAMVRETDGNWLVLARVGATEVLLQRPTDAPERMPRAAFDALWSGETMLLGRRGDAPGSARGFGFQWFLRAFWKYRQVFGEVLVASFFLQLFALVTPLFFQVVVDKVLVHRGLTTLDVLIIGLLGIAVFDALLGGIRGYLFAHTASRIDVELGARVFEHLLRLPLAWFLARPAGQTVARVREIEGIREFLASSFLTLSLDLFFSLAFLVVLYLYSPPLALLVAASLPVYALISLLVTPALRRRTEERFERGAANQALLVESVTGVETLKAMALEPVVRRRFEDQLAGYARASFRALLLGTWATQSVTLVTRIVTALVLWLGARAVIAGEMSVGQLVAFNMIAGQLNAPVLRIAQLWQQLQQARLSVARLGDVLLAPVEPARVSRTSLPRLVGAVRFEHVCFRYPGGGAEALADFDLELPAGQVVGVVGRSGSGKSTLTRLLQRLYVPDRGRVLVDGMDIAQADPAWLRLQVGVVLQESVLFSGSVRDNIALSQPGMPMTRVEEVARLAGAHEFVAALPEGYDTELGERGARLSGGQRQRIAIARALAMDPRILVLDEATSALDYEAESVITANLRLICRGRTVLIIAHRLSTVRHVDRIVALDNGRLIEDGAHRELLAADGFYARQHRRQAG